MKKIALMLALATLSLTAVAQPAGGPGFWGPRQETIKVWPDGAPNAFTYDVTKDPQGENYQEAILEIYPARNPSISGCTPKHIPITNGTADKTRITDTIVNLPNL